MVCMYSEEEIRTQKSKYVVKDQEQKGSCGENYVNVGQLKYKTIKSVPLLIHQSRERKELRAHAQACQTLSVINKLGGGYWR